MIVINDIAGAMLVNRFHRVLSSWEDLGNRRNTWKYGISCCFGRKSMENQWKRVGTLKNIGKLVHHPSTSMEHWNNIGKSWKNNVENRWNIENQHLKSPGLRMCKPQRSSWGRRTLLWRMDEMDEMGKQTWPNLEVTDFQFIQVNVYVQLWNSMYLSMSRMSWFWNGELKCGHSNGEHDDLSCFSDP